MESTLCIAKAATEANQLTNREIVQLIFDLGELHLNSPEWSFLKPRRANAIQVCHKPHSQQKKLQE